MTQTMFWERAEALRMRTERSVAAQFRRVRSASMAELRSVLLQYRFFTIAYIRDLAILVGRLPFGKLRSFLADVLSEELGGGDAAQAHPTLYDSFLTTFGVRMTDIDRQALPAIQKLLGGLSRRMLTESPAYAIGLRGMGGECLCQIYLSQLYESFRQNPRLGDIEDELDWTFWDIHIGEVDVAHREETKRIIDELVGQQPHLSDELTRGYDDSLRAWRLFWDHIFANAFDVTGQVEMTPAIQRWPAVATAF
jgi:hypothetical protein